MNLKDTYNRIAEDWHKDHQADDWWIEGTDTFISFFKPGSLVLDVGCGGGTKSKYLLGAGLTVIGIDFSDKLIDIAKREVPQGEFLVMDMHDAGNLKREFDGIFAQASLLHIPKKEVSAVLHALASKLTIGGFFYIAVKGIQPGKSEEEIKEENKYGYPYQRFFSYYSIDELIRYFKELGFEIVYTNIQTTGKSNWLHVIGRKSEQIQKYYTKDDLYTLRAMEVTDDFNKFVQDLNG